MGDGMGYEVNCGYLCLGRWELMFVLEIDLLLMLNAVLACLLACFL